MTADDRTPGDGAGSDSVYDEGSRVEAAAAGTSHEAAEAEVGVEPREHVTATDVAPVQPHAATAHGEAVPGVHHHPEDPNAGLVRARLGPRAALAGVLAAAVTVAGVVLLAIAIGAK